ncbi:MAG: AAA family ATPase [Desulfurella sp.]
MNILDLLEKNGVEIKKTGSSLVCRCPFCKNDNDTKKHNAQVNTNTNTLYCYTEGKAYTFKQVAEHFGVSFERKTNLIEIDRINETIEQALVLRNTYKEEFEKLLELEIPRQLWNVEEESFQNIGLYQDKDDNNKLKLLIRTDKSSFVWRNKGNTGEAIKWTRETIKWKHFGHKSHWSKLTDKKIVFFASGIAEWLILDWIGVDYIVVRSDSEVRQILNYKNELKDKILAILPDYDERKDPQQATSFEKVIEFIKQNFSKVVVVNIYGTDAITGEKDFRDYTRNFFKYTTQTKDDFVSGLFEAVYYSETNDLLNTETVSDELVYKSLKEEEIKQKYKLTDAIVGKNWQFICKDYLPLARNTTTLISAAGGQGKTWLALNIAMNLSKEGRKTLYWTKEDNAEYLKYRIDLLQEKIYQDPATTRFLYLHDSIDEKFNFEESYFDAIIIDPLLSFFADYYDDENNNVQARAFMSEFIAFAKRTQTTVVILHHHNKNDQTRGASAFIDSSRLLYQISEVKRENKDYDIYTQRKIELKKDNFGVAGILQGFSKIVTIKPKADFMEIEEEEVEGKY